MKLFKYIISNPKIFFTLTSILITIYLMKIYELDIRAITIITIVIGYITNIFTSLTTLISLIPVIGPLIIKIFSIPIFWFINGMGQFSSLYAIKKGYGKDLLRHRLITTVLLIGIVLGYILGNLIPFE
tara:strand:+ start:346 stop:729 length:384 start_codon:yes stop_codon:yes gene_type:complete